MTESDDDVWLIEDEDPQTRSAQINVGRDDPNTYELDTFEGNDVRNVHSDVHNGVPNGTQGNPFGDTYGDTRRNTSESHVGAGSPFDDPPEMSGDPTTPPRHDPNIHNDSKFDIRNIWNKYILRKPVTPSHHEIRHISVSAHSNKFMSNYVSTTKYNIATFLPKFLFEQFSKFANMFFLITALIQQIPNVSPTNRYTTIGTILVVLLVSATKELAEDWRRWLGDKELNNSKSFVLESGGQWVLRKWSQIKVGDIIRVEKGQAIPADLIIVSTSEPAGLCYVETSNLDGETNLKIKQARVETSSFNTDAKLSELSTSVINSEAPNSSLYTYEGTLQLPNESVIPLGVDQLLLRGTSLRNTQWIQGIVVFTGHETKLMRNATATPIKRTAVEHMMDYQIVFLLMVLFVMCITASIGSVSTLKHWRTKMWYLKLGTASGARTFFNDFLTYWILLSNLVPISLFVTIDIIKYWLGLLISSDMAMYDEEFDQPAVCRTSSLVEELGQIKYIFSDKTGTLTRNVMEFKALCLEGQVYSTVIPEEKKGEYHLLNSDFVSRGPLESEIMTLLATCHTVIPEYQLDGEVKYQASSPDEGALVEGAAKLGAKFVARTPIGLSIELNNQLREYDLLQVCEFNSTRKRMSTVLRTPEGKIVLYTKGADTVIFERLKNPLQEQEITPSLEEFASQGLRTLCLAKREISEEEYSVWSQKYQTAATSLTNRSEQMSEVAEQIEKDLELLGATAIEDKLQDGVPETISALQDAGCKIWVLTGDRQETAINIGLSSKLLSEDMNLLLVNESNFHDVASNIKAKKDIVGEIEREDLALVIDGNSLTHALHPNLSSDFLKLATACKAVICCRVSPLQKALVVRLAKKELKDLLLAIGDGANDVSMIQAAHVGIGIAGREGQQAARSADIAIAQFQYLRRLLLVHGMWSYNRLTRAILYSFYKNIALFLTQFWYIFFNGFSGQSAYESWTVTFYNVFSTAYPPFAMGILDQFVSARLLLRYPQLYRLGQQGAFLNTRQFWEWIFNGVYHSVLVFVFTAVAYGAGNTLSSGLTWNSWTWGAAMYTCCVLTVLGKAALITNVWNSWTMFAIPGSAMFWFVCFPLYGEIGPRINVGIENYGLIPALYRSCVFWALCLLIPTACLLRDIAWKYFRRMYKPEYYHYVQEIQKFKIPDTRPQDFRFQKAIRKVRQVSRMRKQRGFAFSAAESGSDRVVRAYNRQ